ncbi:MAG: SHOCT domain-containing protein [Bacteroidota bacterium]
MFHEMNAHGWGMGWTWIIGFILLIIVILLVYRLLQIHNQSNTHSKSPLDILKERYAKGEIDKEEFEERKKNLL